MKIFDINKSIKVVCESKSTRNGFKHTAVLFKDNIELNNTKICYLNRSWERYEFQSVLSKVVKASDLTEKEKRICESFINKDQTDLSGLKTIGNIAKLSEVFCETKEEKNDWKLRMLKAGLENKGLSIPEDWDSLDENTKQERLNKVIEVLK